jgi:hypothetical protein
MGYKESYDKARDNEHSEKAGLGSFCCGGLIGLFLMAFYYFYAYANPDVNNKLPQHGGSGNGDLVGYECYAAQCGLPVGAAKIGTTRLCHEPKRATDVENVSAQMLTWFTMMFWVSVLSFISVVLGCLGTCMSCCGWMGSCAHFLVNVGYVILIIYGTIYRFTDNGAICSGDRLTNVWDADKQVYTYNSIENVPKTAKWQYWHHSGFAMYCILIFQYITIVCMCFCSCCLNCKNKKDD